LVSWNEKVKEIHTLLIAGSYTFSEGKKMFCKKPLDATENRCSPVQKANVRSERKMKKVKCNELKKKCCLYQWLCVHI
jgi:hypothetical protein